MLQAAEYGSTRITASTGSTSSDAPVSKGSAPNGSVRRIRLSRPPATTPLASRAPFGFSVRGGKEHDTGFFVSHVDHTSEAYNKGLRIGDQVIRVNGYRVNDVLHKEMIALIASLNYINLKVRHVGMIPVKEKSNDPLSWRMVPESIYSEILQRSSPVLSKDEKIKDVRLTVLVPSRSKLGCGICKGPDWKPGIYVQFTKENGIARESGLRQGDQIIQCNGIDFRDIQFSDAVGIMKQSRRLDLWIRTGAGLDLFPGESSGYNSSASSATGDQSPSSADHKRLSIVKEETLDLEDRLSQLDNGRYRRKTWDSRSFEWERENSIKEEECKNSYDFSDYSAVNPKSQSSTLPVDNGMMQNKTIINLSEKGTTIQSNYVVSTVHDRDDYSNKSCSSSNISSSCSSSEIVVADRKTIVVDVHRSEVEIKENVENVTNIELQQVEEIKKACLKTIPPAPITSIVSLTSTSTNPTCSLSNAISQEFQKRAERLKKTNFDANQIEEAIKNRPVVKSVVDEKKQKHEALMDEFKKAHKRMFPKNAVENAENNMKNLCTFKQLDEENCVKTPTAVNKDRPLNAYNGMTTSTKIINETLTEDIKSNLKIENGKTTEAAKIVKNGIVPKQNGVTNGLNTQKRSFKPPGQPPPPPPPMPEVNKMNGHGLIKPKAPPPPPIKKPLQNINGVNNSFDGLPVKPPSTPTPDYDTSSIIKVTNKPKLIKAKSDAVEMQSIESFKMTNPSSPAPRPPSTYFMKQPTDVLTVKKSNPQVSVVIGEYPTNTFRKQPSKLEFLSTDTVDGDKKTDESVGSRLQSELIQTLSRSNLRTKTESDGKQIIGENIISNMLENDEPNANFYKRYGNNTQLPQPAPICIPKVPIGKSLSHNMALMSDITRAITNGKQELVKSESLPQNGILKNVTAHSLINHSNAPIKLSSHNKSIKFGQTTTLIGEPENIQISINH